jgi:hypothetical protein
MTGEGTRGYRGTRREIPRLAAFYRDPDGVANFARFGMTPTLVRLIVDAISCL